MNVSKLFLSKKFPYLFSNLLVVVFISSLVPLLLFTGCKKNGPTASRPEVTLQNLQTAYNREMRISKEYALFSENADKSRFSAIAKLYKAVSRSEEIHAGMAATLLRSKGVEVTPYVADAIPVGTVMQTLRLSLSDESLETESMYPSLVRTAKAEKFPEAVELFGRLLNSDKLNQQLFKDAVDRNGYISMVQYYVCPACGCIITSDTVKECPESHVKREMFEKI